MECTLLAAVTSPIAYNLTSRVNPKRIGTAIEGSEVVHHSIPKKRIGLIVTRQRCSSDTSPESLIIEACPKLPANVPKSCISPAFVHRKG